MSKCFYITFQTVLSGDVYTNFTFLVDIMDVSLELLERRAPTQPVGSLARWLSICLQYLLGPALMNHRDIVVLVF